MLEVEAKYYYIMKSNLFAQLRTNMWDEWSKINFVQCSIKTFTMKWFHYKRSVEFLHRQAHNVDRKYLFIA